MNECSKISRRSRRFLIAALFPLLGQTTAWRFELHRFRDQAQIRQITFETCAVMQFTTMFKSMELSTRCGINDPHTFVPFAFERASRGEVFLYDVPADWKSDKTISCQELIFEHFPKSRSLPPSRPPT
ncbi:hypothetical protein A0H81_13341 [Grifola frondosa]|uniref:Uncharacterized protein n=1 Tax=Grifola frondosa TaxID=5627 RepID=A0A1C7LSE6_GRIFR|nr:hypothetical protein A0H81_13341 [Grifola frondosa]